MTRPLSPREREILEYLVAEDPILQTQIRVASFREEWFEGSQSFDIDVPDGVPLDRRQSNGGPTGPWCSVYLPGAPHDEAFAQGQLFLWITDGKIDSLEYAWYTDEMPDRLPDLTQLGPVATDVYSVPPPPATSRFRRLITRARREQRL